jgi:hypothetical protein
MKMSMLDRLFLLAAAILASYQIVVGIDQLSAGSILAYTISFGVLLVAALLLLILGFEAMDSAIVVIISTIIPLSLALGLVLEKAPALQTIYLVFCAVGLLAVIITRSVSSTTMIQTTVLTIVHGVAGLTIFLLPILVALNGQAHPAFALVGLGGALIGSAGLLLSLIRVGRPLLAQDITLRIFPGLLCFMTACFVAGFIWG